ncbi:MAG: biotin attachment protein [Sandarakinorhabdus sp.]|nr:biotin attachment protein [Sandarakinorhabdus sp.]
MTEVRVPTDLWPDDDTAESIVWLFADGAAVIEGELIAEILVEKATLELYAPASGTLRIGMDADDAIDKGQLVANIA